jgi:hypothetical protein
MGSTPLGVLNGGMINMAGMGIGGVPGMPMAVNPMMAGIAGLGGGGGYGGEHSNVVMVSNLPMGITDDQVRELVSPFGALKAFNSIKTSSGTTQAAVFEYEDPNAAEGAIGGLDKLEIADHRLSVTRVPAHAAGLLLQPKEVARFVPQVAVELPPTPVIRLSNMTTPEDLSDDELYMELQEDVSEECNNYGAVKRVFIPRGTGGGDDGEEVGMLIIIDICFYLCFFCCSVWKRIEYRFCDTLSL